MKKLLAASVFGLLLSTTAYAQSSAPAGDQQMPPRAGPAELPTPAKDMSSETSEKSSSRVEPDDDLHSRGRGARIRIEQHGMSIDMRCPSAEPLKDCSDFILQVLDRLQSGDQSDDGDRRGYDRERPRPRY